MKNTLLSLLFAASVPIVLAAGVEEASVEQTNPTSYAITFKAAANAGPVAIYVSSRPDRIDATRPAAETRTSPFTVTAPANKRVYFHLKPQTGPTKVVATRAIELEGGINFRDLGGYATTDGKTVKWGTVFRSAKLDRLTDRDFALLNEIGLKLICDFRMPAERGVAITNWKGENPPVNWQNPIDTPAGPRNRPVPAPTAGPSPRGLASTYRWMAIEGLPEFAALMKKMAAGDLPTLFHCQEGRGRTGLFAALLLGALNVPRETIMKDFMLTNDYLLTDGALQRMINEGGTQTIEQMRNRLRITPDYLEASWQAIDERFKTYDDFLRDGLKMTNAEIVSLRSRLLE